MEIGIIGAGATGLLLGAYLGVEHNVHMVIRDEKQRKMIKDHGIVCDVLDTPTLVHVHSAESLPVEVDLWMITVKQYHLPSVLDMNIMSHTPCLFLQNGMGHLDKLAESNLRSWVGVIEHGALKRDANNVAHTGKGNIQIAAFQKEEEGRIQEIILQLHTPAFPFYFKEDYYQMLAGKLVVNTVINPLTALFQQRNGCITSNPHIQKLAAELCKEACFVLGLSFEEEWERVQSIADKTERNYSSMLKDLMEERRTEVDAISGYILHHKQDHLPAHAFVVRAIHALEYEKGVRCSE
ncbi:2-dehydropantoate 2-reductase [Halobacillus litoralis]|uniref:2-dehydropantoate 2-reductase n=1 Tax=Halobacillus litoralis TaxID=45668 RepID=UPI001CFDFB1E|nr:2-dehydropantoate 2-reductase [Halobacillus litoralis]